jgi:hypothetical protein
MPLHYSITDFKVRNLISNFWITFNLEIKHSSQLKPCLCKLTSHPITIHYYITDYWKDNIKIDLRKKRIGGCALDLSGSG